VNKRVFSFCVIVKPRGASNVNCSDLQGHMTAYGIHTALRLDLMCRSADFWGSLRRADWNTSL